MFLLVTRLEDFGDFSSILVFQTADGVDLTDHARVLFARFAVGGWLALNQPILYQVVSAFLKYIQCPGIYTTFEKASLLSTGPCKL